MSSPAVSHTDPAITGARPTSTGAFSGIGAAGFTSIAMVALNLRPAVTSIGSVLGDLHMSSWVSTTVVAIPPAVLAAGSLATARLTTRWSTSALITSSLTVLAAALALRVAAGPAALLTGTVTSAFAVAVIGVLLPAVVRAAPRRQAGLATATYTAAIGVGATTGSLLTPLLSHTTSWRIGAGSWALVSAAAAVVVAANVRRQANSPTAIRTNELAAPVVTHGLPWHSPTAWWTATYYGALVGVTITIMGWLPTVLRDAQVAPTPAATAFATTMFIGAPVALLLPRLRKSQQTLAVTAATNIGIVGLIGLLRSPGTAPVLWACLIGFALGVFAHGFIIILTQTTRDSTDTARLSAMSQGVGYLAASVCAFTAGELHTSTGGWNWPLTFLLTVFTVLGISAVRITHRSTGDPPATPATPAIPASTNGIRRRDRHPAHHDLRHDSRRGTS